MGSRFKHSFVYAKLCGAMSTMMDSSRAEPFVRSRRVSELYKELFGEAPPISTESALVSALERKAVAEALREAVAASESLGSGEDFPLALAARFEIEDAKRLVYAVRSGKEGGPELICPSSVTSINASAYPALDGMFRGSRYPWLAEEKVLDIPRLFTHLDAAYFDGLRRSVQGLPRDSASVLMPLVDREEELANCIWAIRLAASYGYGPERIGELLMVAEGKDLSSAALSAAALKLDDAKGWASWKFARLIGGSFDPSFRFDIGAFESSSSRHIVDRSRLAMKLHPFGYAPIYAFFKAKDRETRIVTGCVEGIQLGIAPEEILAYIGNLK